MQVITLLNEKGGVGKTTLAVHIAAGLALRGKRVLLVDADAQANATTQLRLPESGGLYQLLVKEAEWRDVLLTPNEAAWSPNPDTGKLLVLPSNIETRVIPMLVDDVQLLRERLNELAGRVDVVVIDTSPTPSLLQAMIYLTSDFMVYPTTCEILSMTGLGKSIAHMQRSQNTRQAFGLPAIQLLGIQPTLYQANTSAHQHGLQQLREKFGSQVWEPIANRTIWREASFAQQTIFAYEAEGVAAGEMIRTVNCVTNNLELSDVR